MGNYLFGKRKLTSTEIVELYEAIRMGEDEKAKRLIESMIDLNEEIANKLRIHLEIQHCLEQVIMEILKQ